MADAKKEIGKTNGRQGETGHNVPYVLAVSLGAAALALIVLVIAFIA